MFIFILLFLNFGLLVICFGLIIFDLFQTIKGANKDREDKLPKMSVRGLGMTMMSFMVLVLISLSNLPTI